VRIAIVNDMRMAVEALRRVLAAAPGLELAWIALDGGEAVKKCAEDRPDLVLMDLIMPVMDGVEATRQIMARSPCPILVVTANVTVNASKVYEAMGYGALDAVNTPVLDKGAKSPGAVALLAKIKIIGHLALKPADIDPHGQLFPPSRASAELPPLVAIGASTGGPKAVAAILAGLPSDMPSSIVIVQHIDEVFAKGLADWLGQQCRLPVRVAAEGERPAPGVVHVAGTNDHLVLREDATFAYTPRPVDLAYRPSVDVFFDSLASFPSELVIAVLLTGIGADGARGLLRLRQAGRHTIAQDEASCVVFGMPKAAIEIGAAVEILPVDRIGPAILARLRRPTFHERNP
jgi:chemotaxis response regulator CheB